MKNKKVLIILGVVAVAGIGYYFWRKKQNGETTTGGSSTIKPFTGQTNTPTLSDTNIGNVISNANTSQDPILTELDENGTR